jgi:hypothetical protein
VVGESEVDDLDVLDGFVVYDPLGGGEGGGGEQLALGPEHHHDVLGLEVAVDDLQRVQVKRGLNHLADDEGRNVLREAFPALDVLVKVVAVDILSDDVDVRLAADGLLVLDDLRVGDDLHDFALVVEGGDGLRGQLLSADVLQRERPPRLLRSAPVDDRELASPDHLVRTVEVVQRVALVESEALQVAVGLRLGLEVEDELGVVLVPVADLDAATVAVPHLLHLQPLQAHHPHWVPPLLVGVGQDQHVLHQHAVDGSD